MADEDCFEPSADERKKITKNADLPFPRDRFGRFLKGHAPPAVGAGRPLGARSRLSEKFIEVIADRFEKKGAAVIDRLIADEPATFIRVVAKLVPAQIHVEQGGPLDGLDAAALASIIALAQHFRSDPASFAKLVGGVESGGEPKTIEGSAAPDVGGVPPVQKASPLSWTREDIEREIAARGKPTGEDARGRNGNGVSSHGPVPRVVDGETVQ